MNRHTEVGHRQSIHDLIPRLRQASALRDGPEAVRAVLAAAVADDSDWLDPQYQERPETRDWVLYPLYRASDGHLSILVAVFKAGVSTTAHNHGAWAVVGVYRGRERETWYRRLDDGSAPGRARLQVADTFVNPRGTVTVVPDGTIHSVEALDGTDAISIHVYGTDILTQNRSTFDLRTGSEAPFRPDFTDLGPEH